MEDLCTACLCTGRKLYFIGETGFYHVYSQILNEIPVYDLSQVCIRVCWECRALLRRLHAFKQLVKTSYTDLLQYAHQNFPPISKPPRLMIHQVSSITYTEDNIKLESQNNTDILAFGDDTEEKSAVHFPADGHFEGEDTSIVNNYTEGSLVKTEVDEVHNEREMFANNLNIVKPKRRKEAKKTNKNFPPISKPPCLMINQVSKITYAEDNIKLESQNNTDILAFEDDAKEKSAVNFPADGHFEAENTSTVNNYTEVSLVKTEVDEVHNEREMFANNLNIVRPKRKKETKKTNKTKQKIKDAPKKTKKEVKIKVKSKGNKKNKTDIKTLLQSDNEDLNMDSNDFDGEMCEDGENGEVRNEEEINLEKPIVQKEAQVKKQGPKKAALKEPLPERPQCAECGKWFSSRKTYRYHLNVLHKGQNRYPCPQCGKVYQWKSNLGRHIRSHKARDSGELYCETCDKCFASVATYRQHLRISRQHITESEFNFMCNECGKKFVNKTRLRDHIDWEHLNRIKFRCQLCDKPFKCHTSLYVHLQNVHRNKEKKDNLCHVCGKSYQNAAKLKYHIVAMHSRETPYRCAQCAAAFGWYSSLYRHVREVHYKMKPPPKKGTKTARGPILPLQLPHTHVPT